MKLDIVPKRKIMKEWQTAFPNLEPCKKCFYPTSLCMRHDFFIIGIMLDVYKGKYVPQLWLRGLWCDCNKSFGSSRYDMVNTHVAILRPLTIRSGCPMVLNHKKTEIAIDATMNEVGMFLQDHIYVSDMLKFVDIWFLSEPVLNNPRNPGSTAGWLCFKMALANYFDDKVYKEALTLEINTIINRWDKDFFKFQWGYSLDEWRSGFFDLFGNRNVFMERVAEYSADPEISALKNGPIINDLSTMNGNYYPIMTPGRFGPIKDYFKKIRYKMNH